MSFVISQCDNFEYDVTTLSLEPFFPGVIQVDLGRVRSLSGVATQGYMPGMFVSSYRVNYSTDGYTWRSYKNRGDSRSKVRETKAPSSLLWRNLTTEIFKCFSFTLRRRSLKMTTISGHFVFVFEEN